MTTKKSTGLAQFTAKRTEPAAQPQGERTRGKKETVALTVRVSRADWSRLHQLATDEGISLQTLALRGLSSEFVKRGLPSIA